MSKYRVSIGSNCYESIEVEAKSKDEAEEIALEETTIEEPVIEGVEKL